MKSNNRRSVSFVQDNEISLGGTPDASDNEDGRSTGPIDRIVRSSVQNSPSQCSIMMNRIGSVALQWLDKLLLVKDGGNLFSEILISFAMSEPVSDQF